MSTGGAAVIKSLAAFVLAITMSSDAFAVTVRTSKPSKPSKPPMSALHPSGSGSTTQQTSSGSSTTVTYTGTPVYIYSGGLTIPSPTIQGVYLGSLYSTTSASEVTTLETFLKYLVGSTFMTGLSPYGISTGTAVTGKVLNVSLPLYKTTSTYLDDTVIQQYLATYIKNGTLIAPTASTLYCVYVEPGVAVSMQGATSIVDFGGYHNYSSVTIGSTTTNFAYAVLPHPGSPNPTPRSQGFASVLDNLTAVTSHEIAEACTDPDIYTGYHEDILETFNTNGSITTDYLYGEEIGDVPLILFNYGSTCYCKLGGYVLQNMIAMDGVSLIVPTGSTAFVPPPPANITASFSSGLLTITGDAAGANTNFKVTYTPVKTSGKITGGSVTVAQGDPYTLVNSTTSATFNVGANRFNVSAALGDGNDAVTFSSLYTTTATVSLGAGDDAAIFQYCSITGSLTVDGGAGTDTVTFPGSAIHSKSLPNVP